MKTTVGPFRDIFRPRKHPGTLVEPHLACFLEKPAGPFRGHSLWGLFLIATVWTEKNSARWIRNAFPFFRLLPPHECMCDKFYWFSTRFRPTLILQGLSKSSWLHPEGGQSGPNMSQPTTGAPNPDPDRLKICWIFYIVAKIAKRTEKARGRNSCTTDNTPGRQSLQHRTTAARALLL